MKKWFVRVKSNEELCWWICLVAKYMIVAMVLLLCGFIGARIGQEKALAAYEQWFEDYKIEQEQLAIKAIEEDPYTIQLNAEAELLAKVLYGVKDNDTDDLRTYCWCVFNRVENISFPDNLADVIAQPNQWMRYDKTNPVIERLYDIAREELDYWHTSNRRPVSSDYVFMNWSANDICLRDVWTDGSGTHYWRYGQ